jgi:hypothetical protein
MNRLPLRDHLPLRRGGFTNIDRTLSSIQTSVLDVDEINALLREILKELKKS